MHNPAIQVLVVDDNRENYALIHKLLKKIHGKFYETTWCNDEDKAKEELEKEAYHVYLIKYHFDGKKGLSLLKHAIYNNCRKPVIMLTEKSDQKEDQEVLELGAADYLIRETIDHESLERAIRYSIKQYEFLEQLRENERKFRILFERSIDAIILLSFNGDILTANQSFADLFGKDKDKIHGRSFRSFFSNKEDFDKFWEQMSNKGRISEMEVELKTGEDTSIHALIKGNIHIQDESRPHQYQVLVHNITQRKKAKKQLVRAEKHFMTGRIARTIAHEVRNPLTNINLALEQLYEMLEGNEEALMFFDIIDRNSNRINQLISELLHSSKPYKPELKPACIHELIEETIHLTNDRLKLKGIKLEKNFDESIPLLKLDSSKMRTALLNVMINAIEAMEKEKGKLEIVTWDNGDTCDVIIKDNGSGISQEEQDKLFDPFYTGKQSGTGLGLTAVQNIINSHKGTIDVESEPGKGTRFIISLNKE